MPPESAREATQARGRRPDRRGREQRWGARGRRRPGSLVYPFAQCGGDRAGPVADAELAVDRSQVGLDGLLADHQLAGDTTVRQAVDDTGEDLALALRESLARTWPEFVALHPGCGVGRPCRHARVDRGGAAVHELQLTHELVAADALQEI